MATSTKGWPKIIVDQEQLEFFRSLHFSWEEIATILGISSKTLKRRAREWNIPNFSTLTDAEPDRIVREYMQQFPNCGDHTPSPYKYCGRFFLQCKTPCLDL